MSFKTCAKCGRDLPESAFVTQKEYKGRPARLRSYCRACDLALNHSRRMSAADKVNAIKLGLGCTDCGYDKHPHALDFDHLVGHTKVSGISRMVYNNANWDALKAEMDKCEVVCANCHRIRTAERRV